MKKTKAITSIVTVLMLGGIAASVSSCGPSWRNNFAYDIDFNADVKGTTIEFWTGFGSSINDVLEPLLSDFTKMTGINVKYESKGSYDNVLNATTLSATSGTFPNVVVGYPDHFATYVNQDIIVRLDYYFENDVHSVFEPEGESFKLSDFYEDYMVENQSIEFDKDGNPYTLGIPFNKSTEVLIYNSTFFDWVANQADLNTKIFVPSTYEEVNSVGEEILKYFDEKGVYGNYLLSDGTVSATDTSSKENPLILNLHGITKWNDADTTHKNSFKPFSYDSQANLFITSIRQNGGTYTYYDKNDKQGYIGFNSEETINALNTLNTYYKNHTFGIPADWDEAKYGSNPFKAQKTLMTLGSSAGVTNDAPTGNAFDIKAAPVPYFSADKKFVISQGANLALLDKGSREERLASWLLVKFLTKYANGYLCAATGYYPASPYAENGGMWNGDIEEYVDYASFMEEGKTSLSTAEKIKAQTAAINTDYYVKASEKWTKFVDQPFPGSASIRTQVANVPKFLFIDKMTPQGAIDAVLERLQDYIKK